MEICDGAARMSLEDEVVLADIEVAGRLLTDSIARDSRFASCDLQDALDAARFSSHPYSSPPKEVQYSSSSSSSPPSPSPCQEP